MITTTATAIIRRIVEIVERIVPLELSSRRFKLNRSPNPPLARWASTAGANVLLRLFEVRRAGGREDPSTNDPAATIAAVPIVVSVVYPPTPKLYGLADQSDLEALVESDAHQIRDALHAPTALVTGHMANLVSIDGLGQGEDMWFQDLTVSAIFYIEQRR